MDNHILSALKAIDVSTLSRADWIAVGMALKEEGYPCSIWDDWSRNDRLYHPGECERKWNSFHGSGTPVKGGTIIQMAKDRGWTPFDGEDGCMNWDDTIEYDGEDGFNGFTPPDAWNPSADLITYLELLFDADDRVGYVTNDVWQDAEGKWLPSKGVYDRTAGELIASLKKHPDDLGATVGDWKPEVGAWIRFNPLDGGGVKNENVTGFRFALVESDTFPIAEQDIVFRKLELPIAALVHSGGKSLHAIVRVDAENYEEYRKRVEFLYDFLEKNGVSIDKQNRNPSRLSRMHGVTRNGNRQYLITTNIGRKSWVDWLGFQCKKGRVLYVNLEIDPASAINRFLKIYDALGLPIKNADSIVIWNLRGHAVPLDQLVPKLIRRVRDQHFDAIIIDPIYKVITGDENNASEMGAFCNQFDNICTETGCSTIYCHHHSKGAQGMKKAMDRASGSGVFARDPDAQLDMIQLELSDDIANNVRNGSETAWRLESSLREFPNIKPVNFWFEYPIHKVDDKGTLGAMPAQGTPQAGRLNNPKSKTPEDAAEEFRTAFAAVNVDGKVTVRDMVGYMNVIDKTVYARLKKMGGEFTLDKGVITKADPENG